MISPRSAGARLAAHALLLPLFALLAHAAPPPGTLPLNIHELVATPNDGTFVAKPANATGAVFSAAAAKTFAPDSKGSWSFGGTGKVKGMHLNLLPTGKKGGQVVLWEVSWLVAAWQLGAAVCGTPWHSPPPAYQRARPSPRLPLPHPLLPPHLQGPGTGTAYWNPKTKKFSSLRSSSGGIGAGKTAFCTGRRTGGGWGGGGCMTAAAAPLVAPNQGEEAVRAVLAPHPDAFPMTCCSPRDHCARRHCRHRGERGAGEAAHTPRVKQRMLLQPCAHAATERSPPRHVRRATPAIRT